MNKIPFNKPYLAGNEMVYIEQAVKSGKISGDGQYTNKCHNFLEQKYGFKKCLLTTSCTDALEMAAILINIQPGDEVIVPAFTFVSTANAFVLRGAKIVFADSRKDYPGIDEASIESLITPKTKAIVPVHYAGIACNMEVIMDIANKYNLWVIEDAAQAIDSYFIFSNGTQKPLGSFGHLAAFSFHETKNIISGEGGMLVINDEQFFKRAEIIREKGTNRSAFFRGEIDKYGWVDIGSSFLPSEIIAAFLWGQLENLETIQKRRIAIWNYYYSAFSKKANQKFTLPSTPQYATQNGHMFYIVFDNLEEREKTIKKCNENNIQAVFHYSSLNQSLFYSTYNEVKPLQYSDYYSSGTLRLPLFYELTDVDLGRIVNTIQDQTVL